MRFTMKQFDLDNLIENKQLVEQKLIEFREKDILKNQPIDEMEVQGHIQKSEHNLRFIQDNLKLGYFDWCLTGCYYTVYHSALALLIRRGFTSKNHYATLCVLIKEYYNNGISKEDILLIDRFFLDYQDLTFYVESKNKREEATYSTKRMFDKKLVELLRIKAALFVDKVKGILNNKP